MSVRFGLLGAGRIGKVHARAVDGNPEARLVAVADAVPKAAKDIAAAYGTEVRTIDEIAKAKDIDAVVICTPTDTHANLIEKFAQAGKAIFCEKPIDLSVARVRECIDVVVRTKTPLMVGFNRRFDPHFMAVKEAVDSGSVGKIEQVQITSRDPGPPPYEYVARSGGIFRDMMIHDFDMARFLLGAEPVSVTAHGSALVDREIGRLGDFDTASAILTTKSGQQCVITNSRRATYGYDQRIEVAGSKGMAAAENLRPVSVEIATAKGFTRPALHDFFMTRYVSAYANEIAAFVTSVRNGTSAKPDGNDGLAALLLAEAALRSVAEKRTVLVKEVAG